MSTVTDPILLDRTGQDISAKLQKIVDAIIGGTIDPITITANGTYTPTGQTAGYGPVTVNVGQGGNAYASTVPPDASIGQNGDYYFELWDTSIVNGLVNDPTKEASTETAGWEFTANSDIRIVGARALARSAYTGTITLAKSDGTVLAEKSVQTEAEEWVTVEFDNPIQLINGENYIIMLFGRSSTLRYQSSPIATASQITYVRGRYGSLPGSTESGTAYSVDILIEGNQQPPYPFKTQYYKTGGVWEPV